MIWESHYWKNELGKIVTFLKKKSMQKHWSSTDSFKIEKNIFFAAYAIRKLIEAKTKLSDAVENQKIKVTVFSQKSESNPDLLNWHQIDRFYNLETPTETTLSLKEMCNQFIHSYIFITQTNDNYQALKGIYVTSYIAKEKDKILHLLDINEIIRVLKSVQDDDVCESAMKRDPKTWEWVPTKKLNFNDVMAKQGFSKKDSDKIKKDMLDAEDAERKQKMNRNRK